MSTDFDKRKPRLEEDKEDRPGEDRQYALGLNLNEDLIDIRLRLRWKEGLVITTVSAVLWWLFKGKTNSHPGLH
jgi:hypothetical protein